MRPAFIFFCFYFEKMRSLGGLGTSWVLWIELWNGGVRGGIGVLGFGGEPECVDVIYQ